MKTPHVQIAAIISIMASLFGGSWKTGTALVQDPEPPRQPEEQDLDLANLRQIRLWQTLAGNPYQPVRDSDGFWEMSGEAAARLDGSGAAGSLAIAATGGPDEYGYTWDDGVIEEWKSASGGVEVPVSWSNPGSGAIDLGFPFKFYENTYSQVYVSFNGFLAFSDTRLHISQSPILSPETPNNVIAPQWAAYDATAGYVRYISGGAAPERWLAVEWNRMQMDTYDPAQLDEFTFAAILYESGDIVFQYETMTVLGSTGCAASGIENSQGLDGLRITNFCEDIPGFHDVHITRPAPAARVNITPRSQGGFTRAGGRNVFTILLQNTGELGQDTYELALSSSAPGWAVTAFEADGRTPLVDTDGDGSIDSGLVGQGSTRAVTVEVRAPGVANPGDHTRITLSVESTLNPLAVSQAQLQITVPASFTQAFRVGTDGPQSLYMIQPDRQTAIQAGSDGAEHGVVAEAPNGNLVSVWAKERCLDAGCGVVFSELELAILGRNGNIIRPAGKLTDFSGNTTRSLDLSPVIAVAPNGKTGVIWQRILYNDSGVPNYNLMLAILDSAGNLSTPVTNLTQNQQWGAGAPYFFDGRIAATGDNRFALTWYSSINVPEGGSIEDIYYEIRDTQAAPVASGKITNDTAGYEQTHYAPTVTRLANNRVLVTFARVTLTSFDTQYLVLDSSGNVVKAETNLDSIVDGYRDNYDAAQLSDGKILLAWTSWTDVEPQLMYAILDSSYTVSFAAVPLQNPARVAGDGFVSVSADRAGRAILTWMESGQLSRRNLYYSLIASSGSQVTPPVIFRSAAYIDTSSTGAGNTTLTLAPSTAQVDTFVYTPALAGAQPGSLVRLPITFGNAGAATASSVSIRVTLDGNLGYVSNSLGLVPVIGGNTVTLNIPGELAYLGLGQFNLGLSVPDAPFANRYPVTIGVSSAGPEGLPANNTAQMEVMVARLLALPVVIPAP